MTDIGRNDSCPCGSSNVSDDLPWKQVRAAREKIDGLLLEYSTQCYDQVTVEEAWEEWCCDFEEPFEVHGSEFVCFMSWFLVNFSEYDENDALPMPPVAWLLRAEMKDRLSSTENAYLNSIIDEPFSFFGSSRS